MTQRFHRLASVFLLCAMLPLALGISLDFYLVVNKVAHAPAVALVFATLAFATFIGFWFAFPFASRARESNSEFDVAEVPAKTA
ncbi:MAG: hypothetical protein ABR526_09290 [Chthoniobacterales bacterium]